MNAAGQFHLSLGQTIDKHSLIYVFWYNGEKISELSNSRQAQYPLSLTGA